MPEALLEISCPSCSSVTMLRAGSGTCPGCGSSVFLPDDDDDAGVAVADQLDPADIELFDELRSAFTAVDGAKAPSPPEMIDDLLAPGTKLGDFEIIAAIGQGGMGEVYRARQQSLGRVVALKVLPISARRRRFALRRFRIEASAAARLHHTNIVAVHAHGEQNGLVYYAMDLIEGQGLDQVIAAGGADLGAEHPVFSAANRAADEPQVLERDRAAWRRLARRLAGVADALAHAHDAGIVHRDIKPHNLLLDHNGRLHLTDFGLARVEDEPGLTLCGELLGTPAYLAPEQIAGDADEVDARSDIYSFGATLYEAITGARPFPAPTREKILHAILNDVPRCPRRLVPACPVDLERICLKAMERDPAQRYESAAQLAADLRHVAEGLPISIRREGAWRRAVRVIRRHRMRTAIGVTLVLLVLTLGLWSMTAAAARQVEADHALDRAWTALAFIDYRRPDRAEDDLARARDLGADGVELHLADALIALRSRDTEALRQALDAAQAQAPQDRRTAALEAWASWRSGAHDTALEQIAALDERGGPQTAEGWLFRGLALHFHDPDEAVVSYRRAIAELPEERGFFAQAVLHLARARNQQLYTHRRLDGFAEATGALQQLVGHRTYGGYPHYLLSIAHRLAAEVYRNSDGTRPETAAAHYAEALRWSRLGQPFDDGGERCVTAEAECLESMGRVDDAIARRTFALSRATAPMAQFESLHYRWRLRFWSGDLVGAMDDLARCAEFDQPNRFYTVVYPALVLADLGDLEAARALVDQQDAGIDAALWALTTRRLLGMDLAGSAKATRPDDEWQAVLLDVVRGDRARRDAEPLMNNEAAPWRRRAALEFHLAIRDLAAGHRDAARAGLERAYRSFDGETEYTYHARILLERMRRDASWPPWIGAASERTGE